MKVEARHRGARWTARGVGTDRGATGEDVKEDRSGFEVAVSPFAVRRSHSGVVGVRLRWSRRFVLERLKRLWDFAAAIQSSPPLNDRHCTQRIHTWYLVKSLFQALSRTRCRWSRVHSPSMQEGAQRALFRHAGTECKSARNGWSALATNS